VDIGEMVGRVGAFRASLLATKLGLEPADFWYPYGTLDNLGHLDTLLTGTNRDLLALAGGAPIADIGAADGDLAFFLESLGCQVDIIDNGPTNFNGLLGARLVKRALGSHVGIHEIDLDSQFRLPRERYGLVVFLGILYHLQNPYYVLQELARRARHLVLSTRIAQVTTDHAVRFADVPVAYLVAPTETNDDPTNYWIFSDAGLRRIADRTGWDVLDYITVGHTIDSEPAAMDRDERAFCLLRSRLMDPPA
jgi:tRNA (mo5U34)-methyltransferase